MSTTFRAEEAHSAALAALREILRDESVKVEIRVEAAKLILNRPRFFVQEGLEEK